MPRIALGSIVAYIIGQHVDVFIFSMIKKIFSSDKTFIIRAYGSTILSSIIDTALFVIIAFAGTLPNMAVFEIFINLPTKTYFNYIQCAFRFTFANLSIKGKIQKLDEGY